MQTALPLRGTRGANSHRSWEALPHQIGLQGSPQAPRHKVVEWTPKGIGRDVARTAVSPGLYLAICDHMSRLDSSATLPERHELLMENSDAGPLVGRQSIETCVNV